MKIALLGGSFDPVHEGHIQMAKEAVAQLDVEEVWFLPTWKTPLKERNLSSTNDRVQMLELALASYPKFKIDLIEMERMGSSYTVDTLSILCQRYPENQFYWLMGNDQLEQFDRWKEPEKLVKLAQFVCFDRLGKLAKPSYPILCLHMPMMPVSSSDIRKGYKLNYLDPNVLNYIYQHRLYIENFVRERVNPHRFAHSLSVASLCEELAISHHLDSHKAYLIGLFHDIAKSMSKEKMEPWMDAICPENKIYPVPVWHGFVGSEIVKRVFGLWDETICAAIYHHVLGTSTDPYAMIVFCADKLDPLRGYPVQEQIEQTKKDLEKGFSLVKEENKKYLEGKE